MFTDKEAYRSKLKNISSGLKCMIAFFSIMMCVGTGSISVCCIVLISMIGLCLYSGTNIRTLAALFSVPLGFILISSIALAVDIGKIGSDFLLAVPIGANYVGIGHQGVYHALMTALKAVASVSCMYFLALTTPMTALFFVLRKLHLPKFLVEITELIYRYIFILLDTAHRIYIAQEARLGYLNLKNAYHSTGTLAANLFISALKQADRSYIALEARGYTGEIPVMENSLPIAPWQAMAAILYAAVLCSAYIWL